jgi:formamidopyrimidine-DNA glycosylase
MPELPEVETTLRGVSPHLLGHTVRELIVQERRLRWPVPDDLIEIEGTPILSGSRRGKYLLFATARGTLLIHLGMSGSLRVLAPSIPWRKHDHLAFSLDSGMELRFHDPRRFGTVQWIHGDPCAHPLLKDLGPEPLSTDFTARHLFDLSRDRSASIKSFIMDSHIVVGVGNIYACEALFMAGIRPTLAAGKVSLPRFVKLVKTIQEVLAASIEMGGTTLRDFLNESGEPGYFKQTLHVYDREDQPCRICGTPVKRIVQTNRSTFLCPKCQK